MEILRPMSSDVNSTSASAPSSILSNRTATQESGQSAQLELDDLFCILQIEPNDSLIALELGRRLVLKGRFEEAVRLLRATIRIDYRFETLNALAMAEYQSENIEAAFEHFQHAILLAPEGNPQLFEIFKTVGNIFVRRGDLDSAEDSYNKAFRLNPSSDALLVNFGTLLIQRQDWDGALEKFRNALGLNRTNDKAWVGLALGHRMKGDPELAWGNIEAALEYNPLNEVALALALDWGVQENLEAKVLEHLREFLIKGGWSERFSMAFAVLSLRRGDKFLARLELERLLTVNPVHEGANQLSLELRTLA